MSFDYETAKARSPSAQDEENIIRRNEMENLLQLWLNPINLGILFVCLTVGIWILSKSGPWNWK